MDSGASQILKELKAGKIHPIYVLQGEETFYIDRIEEYIESKLLNDSEKSFNQFVLYGRDTPVNVILTHARRFPMMAERQVVIVKEAQDIPDLQKEAGSKLMLDYISRPVPSTVLVLCHKHKTLDRRRELGKRIDQLPGAATFKKGYESQLPEFITEYVLDQGASIDERAVRVLQDYVGNDLQRLAHEIDKIIAGSPAKAAITSEIVMSQVGISREYNIFELQKALVQKDTLVAAKIVAFFEANIKRNPAIPAVAYLFYFFSKLLIAASIQEKNEKALASALKISPFAVRDYTQALQRYSPAQIIANVSLIKDADLRLKGVNSGSTDEGQIFKELVFRLMY